MRNLLLLLFPSHLLRSPLLAALLGGSAFCPALAHATERAGAGHSVNWHGTAAGRPHQPADGTVNGRVVDAKGEGIPGVTVIVEGTSLGASTDATGAFSIANVPAGAHTLVYSSIGLNSVRVAVTVLEGQPTAVAPTALSENVTQLNEAVVVGYGTTRRQDVTGAITTVTTKDFVQG